MATPKATFTRKGSQHMSSRYFISILLLISTIGYGATSLAEDVSDRIRQQIIEVLDSSIHPKTELEVVLAEHGDFTSKPAVDMSSKSDYIENMEIHYTDADSSSEDSGQAVIIAYEFGHAADPKLAGKVIRLIGTVRNTHLEWRCDTNDPIVVNNFPNDCIVGNMAASQEVLALATQPPLSFPEQIVEAIDLVDPYSQYMLLGMPSPDQVLTGTFVSSCTKLTEEPGVSIIFDCEFSHQAHQEIAGKYIEITAVVEELPGAKGWTDISYYCSSNEPVIIENYPSTCASDSNK